jgi:ribosomal protein S18 acetylase RimI-like enzyme
MCFLAVLDILTVDPRRQKLGIGTKLMEAGLAMTDELHLPVYLESTPAGKRLYERFGFRVQKETKFDLAKYGGEGDWTSWIMIREARS